MSMVLPELWSQTSIVVRRITYSVLEKYKHLIKWKNYESILEVGFADGKNSMESLGKLLPDNYKEFIGSDISHDMVNYAKQKYNKLPRYDFMQLNIATEKIPVEMVNRFDHIFSFTVMHLVKNPRQAFRNIYKMLKPGGIMFATMYERTPSDEAFERLSKNPKWSVYTQEDMISSYYHSPNPQEEYIKDIKAAGFVVQITDAMISRMDFTDQKEFTGILTSVNAILPRIPKDQYDDYLKDYFEAAGKSACVSITTENGQRYVKIDCTMLVFIAQKPDTQE